MNERSSAAQIAHVLFLDIVGFSRQSTEAQGQMIQRLNEGVHAAPAFAAARQAQRVQALPTGDGMALLFFDDVMAPAQCALEVARALQQETDLSVRMGLHSGLVQQQIDIAGQENYVGEGLNTAQRVMDFGEEGHILLSAQYATWLQQFDEWTPWIQPLGVAVGKHDLKVRLFRLSAPDAGKADRPAALPAPGADPTSPPTWDSAPDAPRIVLLYKRNLQPDEAILQTLEEQFLAQGYPVFVDRHLKIGVEWAQAIEDTIRSSDAVVAIVSPKALQSEMLEYELETANDQHQQTGKPLILPVSLGLPEKMEGPIGAIIQPLNQFLYHGPEDDQRLVVELLSAIQEPLKSRFEEVPLEPIGGAVRPDSPFYVSRSCDTEFLAALEQQESILLIKGGRQIGKTSLQAQGVRKAQELGWRYGVTDFQKLNSSQIASEEIFYKLLAATLGRQLKFRYDFENEWLDLFGANLNMENFLRDLLEAAEEPLVWFMDEVDKLFSAPFASDFFGLVRSWHNSRSTEPDGVWQKLTVVIAYATEAHLFIQDLNQSPFNVGRKLELEDFNLQQVMDLNGRYGGPLRAYQEVEELHQLLAGHPYLTRKALDVLATGKLNFASLREQAAHDEGPFGDHLKRVLAGVSRLPAVLEYVQAVLASQARTFQPEYYRLYSAGVVQQQGDRILFRCPLYQQYLQKHLA